MSSSPLRGAAPAAAGPSGGALEEPLQTLGDTALSHTTFVETIESQAGHLQDFESQVAPLLKDPDRTKDIILISKILLLTIPGMEKILRGNYERLFGCTTLTDLILNFLPLSLEFYRHKEISYEEKLYHYRITSFTKREERECRPITLQSFIEHLLTMRKAITPFNYTPEEKRQFDYVLALIDSLDSAQTVPVEMLIDPTYFPEAEVRLKEINTERSLIIRRVLQAAALASQDVLCGVFRTLERFGQAGWDREIVWDSLSTEQLLELEAVVSRPAHR